jgi:hypothetical protein
MLLTFEAIALPVGISGLVVLLAIGVGLTIEMTQLLFNRSLVQSLWRY